MINRRNNRTHRLTMDNCIPPLSIATKAYYRVEKLTADLSLLGTQLWVWQQCGFALSSENKIWNGNLKIIEIFQVILRIRPTFDCSGFCEHW